MTDSNTDRAIGRLEGQMDHIIKLLEAGSESRRVMYDAQEKMRHEQHDINNRVIAIESAIQLLQPFAAEFEKMKQRGMGAFAVVGFLWLIVGGLVINGLGAIASVVWKLFIP